MKRDEIKNKIHAILINVLEHDDFTMSDQLKASDVTGWNSLAQAMIITLIEDEFQIKFKLKDLSNWKDIGSLTSIIESKLNS